MSRLRARHLKRLLAALGLAFVLGCGGAGDNSLPMRSLDGENPGYRVYQRAACHRCHGLQLEGGRKAPSLLQIKAHFDVASLRRYLANPDSMQAADPRLRALDAQYTTFEMPSYAMLDSLARRDLIQFLLSP